MIKKTFFYSLIIFISILSINSVYSNSNYTDIHLESIGWCAGTEIPFKIYNKTDFENKEEIERKLCDPADKCYENECALEKNWQKDSCDPCDNCLYYNVVEDAKITIYNGPLDSRPILYETTSSNGEFSFTFPTWNQYLIEIETEEDRNGNKVQKYNNLETSLIIEECQTSFEEEEKEEYFDHSFNYLNSEVLVEITNTTIENDSQISVRNDVIIPLVLENSIKTIAITSKNKEFNKIDIKIEYPQNSNAQTQLYKYDSNSNTWNEITNFKKENEYLVLESGELGIYSITQKEDEIVQEPTIEEPLLEEANNQNEEEVIKAEIPANQNGNDSSIKAWQIILIIVGILIIGLIVYLKFGSKNKNHYHDKKNKETKTVLTTYEQTYQETLKYIEKYKDSYSKDQLYRALKTSGVPEDIIDKLFNEKL